MSFLATTTNVATARAKAATTTVARRSFSVASKAKEKKSRQFWPAEVFSGRGNRTRRLEASPSTSNRITDSGACSIEAARRVEGLGTMRNRSSRRRFSPRASVAAKLLLVRGAGGSVDGASNKLLGASCGRAGGVMLPASLETEAMMREKAIGQWRVVMNPGRNRMAGQMAVLLRALEAMNQAAPAAAMSTATVALAGAAPVGFVDMRMFDKTLREYEEAGKWKRALGLLSRMMSEPSSGARPDLSTFSIVVSTCVRAGRWREATNLVSREMPARGITPDAATYSSVIDSCGKWGRWEEALRLLNEMIMTGATPSVATYNNAITLCGSRGRYRLAIDLLDQMLATNVAPNVASYNSVMTACDHVGESQQVLDLLRGMEKAGVRPNVRSYNIAIKAMGDSRDCNAALALFRKMSAVGIAPNIDSFSSVIKAFIHAGQVDDTVSGLLEEMSESMTTKDADDITINGLVIDINLTSGGIVGRASKTWRQTVALFREVEEAAVRGSASGTLATVSQSTIIVGESPAGRGLPTDKAKEQANREKQDDCVKSKPLQCQLQQSLSRLKDMSGVPMPQTAGSYSLAITKCGHNGQWEDALALLRHMSTVGIPPNRKCYHSAIASCGVAKRYKEALELLRELAEAGFSLTDKSYRCAISACGNAGRFQECISLLREARAAGLPPSPGSYSLAIMACGDAGQWEKALSLLKEAEALDIVANGTCYNAAVKACKDCSRPEEAEAVLVRSKAQTSPQLRK